MDKKHRIIMSPRIIKTVRLQGQKEPSQDIDTKGSQEVRTLGTAGVVLQAREGAM